MDRCGTVSFKKLQFCKSNPRFPRLGNMSPEELAMYKNFISKQQFISLIEDKNSEYADILKNTIDFYDEN